MSAKGERVTQPLLIETPSTVSHSSTGNSRGDQSNATSEQSQPKASTKEKFFRSVLEGNSNEVLLLLKSDSALASEVDDQQMSGLHYAARKGDAVMVKVLIDAGANVNLTDREGALPLHIACRYNHEAVIKRLLSTEKKLENKLVTLQMEYKQDEVEKNVTNSIARQDKRGVTPLMLMASACGHQFLKNCLGDLQNVDINLLRIQDSDGNTAMHYAAARNNGPLNITTLHNIEADINATNLEQETPMHVAATLGLEESVRKLLELEADPNRKDKLGRTPLHRGIICKQENICSALLNRQTTKIVVPDADRMTPFHWACRRGQLSVVKLLIQRHPNALDALDIKKRNGLHWAVLTGSLPLVNFLLGNAAKMPGAGGKSRVIDAKDLDLKCPVHYAVKMGDSKLLRAFLNHGASFDVIDSEGRTPTQLAVKLGHIDMVRNICIHSQTLKQQALKHRDMSGRTSLLIAAEKGHTDLFNYLLEQGSDFTAKDEIGRTALMLNVGSGCNAIAKILIDRGVDINAIDTAHNTALHYACKRVEAKAKCVALLLKNGAKLLQNCNGNTPVDLAVINRNEAAINVFFSDDFRKLVMDYRKDNGATHMDTLIEHSPKTAMLILDQSMTPSSTADPTAKDFMVKFDFVHLDPESDDRALAHQRYLALKTMVKHSRMDLLQHPLCQALLKRKWTRSRYFLWIDLAAYVTFLVFLAVSVRLLGPILVSDAPEINSTTLCWNYTFKTTSRDMLPASLLPLKCIVVILTALCFILLVVKRSFKGCNLLLSDRENVAFMLIFTFSIVFIYPLFREPPCFNNGIFGMISVIMGCFMIIFKVQILPGVGIYAQMFQGVFVSMVKLLLIFSCVIFGFALAFHIGFIYHEPFANFPYAFTKTLDMAGGDLEFATYFIKGAKGSMQNGLVVVFNLFVIIIPICLINLLIAVAVGDIKGITKEASLRCIKIQIKLVDAFQNMPWSFLLFPRQDRFLEVYPNRTIRNKVSKWLLPDDEATMYNDWLKRCADKQAETSNEKRLVDIESSIQLLSSRLEEIKRLQLVAKEIKLNVLPSSRSASCTRPK